MGRRLPAPSWGLAALLAHSVLIQAVTFLARPAASYQAIALDAPTALVGVVGAAFALVPLALAVPAGGIVDRFGSRPVIVVGSITALAGTLSLWLFETSLWALLAGMALLGTGHLGCILGQQAAVGERASGRALDADFGRYSFATSLGQVIGPLVITAIGSDAETPDARPMFLAAALGAVALTALAPWFGNRRDRAAPRPDERVAVLQLLRMPGFVRAVSTSAIVVSAIDVFTIYLPVLGAERGISAATVGLLLALRAGASMTSRLLLGTLTGRIGRGNTLAGSLAISAVALALIALPLDWAWLAPAVAIMGFSLGVGQPLTMSWLVERASAHGRGRALALRLTANRIAQVGVPAAMGSLVAVAGSAAVVGTMAVVTAATLLLVRRRELD